jgi:hypothetical protein
MTNPTRIPVANTNGSEPFQKGDTGSQSPRGFWFRFWVSLRGSLSALCF